MYCDLYLPTINIRWLVFYCKIEEDYGRIPVMLK